jgi:hypothetical protein
MERLHSDTFKDKILTWLEGKVIEAQKSGELPDVVGWSANMSIPAAGDETHVIALEMEDGKIFSVLVKLGDYTATHVELSRG